MNSSLRLLGWLIAITAVFLGVEAGWTADTKSQCGGSQNCPCGTANCDAQWPAVSCKEWDVCNRQSATWWQCDNRKDLCWNKVNTWDTCGGTSKCPSGVSTCDAPWKGYCCNNGDVCARQNAGWWRCEPSSNYQSSNTCYEWANTWDPCGNNKCCVNPRDKCVYKDPTWSRCEPQDNNVQPLAQPPRGNPTHPLAISGNRIVSAYDGHDIKLAGVNWFGYNVGRHMADGLGNWYAANVQTDFATIVYQLRLLGYNTVRLPFRWRDLDHTQPTNYEVKCWDMSTEDLRRRLMEPGFWTAKSLPANKAIVTQGTGWCNKYLPNSSTYDRFLYTIQTIISQGMYVVLDYQPMETEYQPYNLQEFVCKWRFLMSRVMALPNWKDDIKGRVIVDVMNEPDSMHLKWEGQNNLPGARDLYLQTLDALHAMSYDGWLYFLEGTGQNNFGLNWGNGFISDYNIIKKYGLSDPNYFFQQLLKKPYAHRVVFTPHVYPPSITKATFLGDSLWQQSQIAFGYLQTKGYCDNGTCRIFPVVIGETGSYMTDSKDNQWLLDFADFTNAKGGARAYNWQPVAGWLWWAYNENSGDTGGIVYNKWTTLNWVKLRWMINSMGLVPWYKDNYAQ